MHPVCMYVRTYVHWLCTWVNAGECTYTPTHTAWQVAGVCTPDCVHCVSTAYKSTTIASQKYSYMCTNNTGVHSHNSHTSLCFNQHTTTTVRTIVPTPPLTPLLTPSLSTMMMKHNTCTQKRRQYNNNSAKPNTQTQSYEEGDTLAAL